MHVLHKGSEPLLTILTDRALVYHFTQGNAQPFQFFFVVFF